MKTLTTIIAFCLLLPVINTYAQDDSTLNDAAPDSPPIATEIDPDVQSEDITLFRLQDALGELDTLHPGKDAFTHTDESLPLAFFIPRNEYAKHVFKQKITHAVRLREVIILFHELAYPLWSVQLYDIKGKFLGYALPSAPGEYRILFNEGIEVQPGFMLPMFVRATLSENDVRRTHHGMSRIQVKHIIYRGSASWRNNGMNTLMTAVEFPIHDVAFAKIGSIMRNGQEEESPAERSGIQLGSFTFTRDESFPADNGAQLAVRDLLFALESDIVPKDVAIRAEGSYFSHACDASKTLIRCKKIPESIGTFTGDSRTFSIFGSFDRPADDSATAQLILRDFGTPHEAGSLTWTDGQHVFSWIDLEEIRGAIVHIPR